MKRDIYLIEHKVRLNGRETDWEICEGQLATSEPEADAQVGSLLGNWGDDLTGLRITLCPHDAPHRDVTEDFMTRYTKDFMSDVDLHYPAILDTWGADDICAAAVAEAEGWARHCATERRFAQGGVA